MGVRLIDVEPRPDVFAAVMATGIVSVSGADHRYPWISDTLDGVAFLALVVMVVLVLRRVGRVGFPYPLSDIDVVVRLFTFVAACARVPRIVNGINKIQANHARAVMVQIATGCA